MTLADELAELHERHMNSANHIEVRGYAIFALKEKLICNLPEIIAALRAKDEAAAHIRAQSAEIAAKDLEIADLREALERTLDNCTNDECDQCAMTRTALKEPGA